MRSFGLLFLVVFLIWRLTTLYVDEVGKTRILATQMKTEIQEAEHSEAELKRAIRYHGVPAVQEDEKGQWYFVRDGKRCKIFGEAYLVHIATKENGPKLPMVTAPWRSGTSETREITTTALSGRLVGKAS